MEVRHQIDTPNSILDHGSDEESAGENLRSLIRAGKYSYTGKIDSEPHSKTGVVTRTYMVRYK